MLFILKSIRVNRLGHSLGGEFQNVRTPLTHLKCDFDHVERQAVHNLHCVCLSMIMQDTYVVISTFNLQLSYSVDKCLSEWFITGCYYKAFPLQPLALVLCWNPSLQIRITASGSGKNSTWHKVPDGQLHLMSFVLYSGLREANIACWEIRIPMQIWC
jgi:hypothetical protein